MSSLMVVAVVVVVVVVVAVVVVDIGIFHAVTAMLTVSAPKLCIDKNYQALS